MIIKPVKQRVKRKLLPNTIMVMPILSFGFSLKTIHVEVESESPFEIIRTSRFPSSEFLINETGEKEKMFRLASNFSGTVYNLYKFDSMIATFQFNFGLCEDYPVRSFSIFYLAPKT